MYSDKENKDFQLTANIKIVGVGGGGNNSVESMIKSGIRGVDFIIANTDSQVLKKFDSNMTIHLGNVTDRKGLGAGALPEVGRDAALESESQIKEKLKGADMVIIAAGMGGGTGTGAAPVVAKVAKAMGALTIGIVTTPFKFEGPKRFSNAENGISALEKEVDSLITISNEKLRLQYGSIPLKDSFIYADTVLKQTVKTMTDIISVPAYINLDFADVTTVMKDKGNAIVGIGRGTGKERAVKAAINAISSPILESSVIGAKDMIVNITGGNDLSLDEANEVVETIKKAIGTPVNIIFGVAIDEALDKDITVSVIATGLSGSDKELVVPEEITQIIDAAEKEEKNVQQEQPQPSRVQAESVKQNYSFEEDEEEDDEFEDDDFFDDTEELDIEREEREYRKYSDDLSNTDEFDDEELDSELPSFLKR